MDGGTVGTSGQAGLALSDAAALVRPIVMARIAGPAATRQPRRLLAREIGAVIDEIRSRGRVQIPAEATRDLVTILLHEIVGDDPGPVDFDEIDDETEAGRQDVPMSLSDLSVSAMPLAARRDETAARILHRDPGNADLLVASRRILARREDRGGAPLNGVADISPAIEPFARPRHEDISRLDPPRVMGDPSHQHGPIDFGEAGEPRGANLGRECREGLR